MDNETKTVIVWYQCGEEVQSISLSGDQATYDHAVLAKADFVKVWANSSESRRTVLIPVQAVIRVELSQ